MSEISIILNDRSYEYDVYTLVIAYYQGVPTHVYDPGEEISKEDLLRIGVDISAENVRIEVGEDVRNEQVTDPSRSGVKHVLKRTLYEMLREKTGRDLPWGA